MKIICLFLLFLPISNAQYLPLPFTPIPLDNHYYTEYDEPNDLYVIDLTESKDPCLVIETFSHKQVCYMLKGKRTTYFSD